MIGILNLLRSRVEASKIRKASGAKGGEWHSPCPLCGGDDRFSVFPNQEGGELCKKNGLRGTWACMRGCGKGGDLIDWFQEVEGMTFAAACSELGIGLESKDNNRRGYKPLRAPRPQTENKFEPREYAFPSRKWREAATKLANDAYQKLCATPAILKYLERRGLPQEAIDRYGLGYIEGEGKNVDCVYRARVAYDLPEKTGKDGQPVRAFRIPRGVAIPVWADDYTALRIRIRRRDADRDSSDPKDPKYLLIPQPGQPYSAPMLLWPDNLTPDLTTWVITEAELDAMAIHHACGGKIGCVSVLTAKGKPDRVAHSLLACSARILVALDVDEDKADGSNPGAEAWLWWKRAYPQARLWPVPKGKDPGEAFARGVDLAAWIMAGSPLFRAETASGSSEKPKREPEAGNMGKSRENVVVVEKKAEFRCRRVPEEARTFFEIELPPDVTHNDLLSSQTRSPLTDPECVLPCPKTSPPFWWSYLRDCKKRKCQGHSECLLGILRSKVFMSALREYQSDRIMSQRRPTR